MDEDAVAGLYQFNSFVDGQQRSGLRTSIAVVTRGSDVDVSC